MRETMRLSCFLQSTTKGGALAINIISFKTVPELKSETLPFQPMQAPSARDGLVDERAEGPGSWGVFCKYHDIMQACNHSLCVFWLFFLCLFYVCMYIYMI